jgi:acyl-[acyl-carrier-protein] desaturase
VVRVQNEMTDGELLDALATEVEINYRRHVQRADIWMAHELVPWEEGRSFAFLGGEDWSPEQSKLGDVDKLALTIAVIISDNLPSYHREIGKTMHKGMWWRWVNRWTAEEDRHSILIRNFLMATRAVDPVELERIRMQAMTDSYFAPPMHLLELLANCAFEEAAAVIRHRNTAAATSDPMVAAICERLATDDELQCDFYADMVTAALELVPEQTVAAIADRVRKFAIPSADLPGRDSTAELAAAGIYDPGREPELVFAPLLRRWNLTDREEFRDVLDGSLAH